MTLTLAYAGYLEKVAASPEGAAIKRRAAEHLALRPGDSVIDVGCGPAVDTVPFASLVGPTGRVTGVDLDAEMVRKAERTAEERGVGGWVGHAVAPAAPLAYPDGSFDAWHSERLLQHLPAEQPLAALREAHRVLRPGGRLVVVDTDWGTLSLATDTPVLERRLVQTHLTRFANGYAGRTLPRLVRQAGLLRTAVESFAVTLSSTSVDYLLAPTEQLALAHHVLTPLEWHVWRRGLADYRSTGEDFATVVMTLVAARRP